MMISLYVLFFLYSSVSAQGRNVGKRKIYHCFVTYVIRQKFLSRIFHFNNFSLSYRFIFVNNSSATRSSAKIIQFILRNFYTTNNLYKWHFHKQSPDIGGVTAECPLLSGVYVSVMRRIFNPGIHKQLLTEVEIMLTTTLLPDKCQLLGK